MNIADYVIIVPTKSDTRFQLSDFNSISSFRDSDCSINKVTAV